MRILSVKDGRVTVLLQEYTDRDENSEMEFNFSTNFMEWLPIPFGQDLYYKRGGEGIDIVAQMAHTSVSIPYQELEETGCIDAIKENNLELIEEIKELTGLEKFSGIKSKEDLLEFQSVIHDFATLAYQLYETYEYINDVRLEQQEEVLKYIGHVLYIVQLKLRMLREDREVEVA